MGCVKMKFRYHRTISEFYFRTSDIFIILLDYIYIYYISPAETFPETLPQKSDFFSFQCRRAAFRNLHSHKITYPMRTPVENHYTILLGASEKLVA